VLLISLVNLPHLRLRLRPSLRLGLAIEGRGGARRQRAIAGDTHDAVALAHSYVSRAPQAPRLKRSPASAGLFLIPNQEA
jgi:hypothetical protein